MPLLDVVLVALVAVAAAGWFVAARRLRAVRRELEEVRDQLGRPRVSRALGISLTPSDAVRSVVGTAIKVKDQGFGGALRSSIDELALWADVERPDLATMASRDGSISILFSDIEDSTALNNRLGDRGWVQVLAKHDRLLTRAIEANAGHVIKTQGDGFMVAFAEPEEAVRAACEIQRSLAARRPGSRLWGIKVRIGAHKGSAVRRDNDLFGRNVAYAARVASQAHGGEVVVSGSLLRGLPEGSVTVSESRDADLKGVPGTQTLHVIDWRGSPA